MLTTMGAWRWAAARRHYTRHVHMVQACTPKCRVVSIIVRRIAGSWLHLQPGDITPARMPDSGGAALLWAAQLVKPNSRRFRYGAALRWARGRRRVAGTSANLLGYGEPAQRSLPLAHADRPA